MIPISKLFTLTIVECQVVPSAGRCRENQSRRFWSYSSKIGSCTELFGCYGIRDRNVFLTRQGCERNCYSTGPSRPDTSFMGNLVVCFMIRISIRMRMRMRKRIRKRMRMRMRKRMRMRIRM